MIRFLWILCRWQLWSKNWQLADLLWCEGLLLVYIAHPLPSYSEAELSSLFRHGTAILREHFLELAPVFFPNIAEIIMIISMVHEITLHSILDPYP